jgi:hypothetical protein
LSVYDATKLELICQVEQNQLVGYGPVGEEHLREGMRRKGQVLRVAKQYRKTQRDAFADLPTLAIRAQQEAQQAEAEETVATMRPVPTVLDGQVVIQRQAATRRAVKKAAGAENMETVPEIDLGIGLNSPIYLARLEREREERQRRAEDDRKSHLDFMKQYER